MYDQDTLWSLTTLQQLTTVSQPNKFIIVLFNIRIPFTGDRTLDLKYVLHGIVNLLINHCRWG